MISHSKRTYMLTSLLAVPPVFLVGAFCNKVVPQPEKVPTVVAANAPDVDSLHQRDFSAKKPAPVQLAEHLH